MEWRFPYDGSESEGGLMLDLIKREVLKAVNATNPVNFNVGTVSGVNPLKITVHQKLTLTKEFLIVTERMTRYEVNSIVIRTGLSVGDKVILARVQGGNQYIVLDKVVD